MKKASDYLRRAADLLDERAKQYDQEGGERSIPKVVTAFNAITGSNMTNVQGWLFMHLVKKVRLHTTPGKFHEDSGEDSTAYDALENEEWSRLHTNHTAPTEPPPRAV